MLTQVFKADDDYIFYEVAKEQGMSLEFLQFNQK